MIEWIKRWLAWRQRKPLNREMLSSYQATFSSPMGQQVLFHLLEEIYCTVAETLNPEEALVLNARRSVVQEILDNITAAERQSEMERKVIGDAMAR